MLVWPKGVDHHVLGAFVFKLMGEFGLERPTSNTSRSSTRMDAVVGR